MKVQDLIKRLATLDPETEVVLMARDEGYAEPIMGCIDIQLIKRRPWSRATGIGEYINAEILPKSKAKRIKAVVIA